MPIKNIVFDVGNVLVRWDPVSVVIQTFPDVHDPHALSKSIFKHETWLALNRGTITEIEAIALYQARLQAHADAFETMMDNVRASLVPLEDSIALLRKASKHYKLYALTDNTLEIMAYLRKEYDFWPLFEGVVVSAEVGSLKPSQEIYQYLLKNYQLHPEETLFIDDHLPNVRGAREAGIKAIQFQNIEQCLIELKLFGAFL
jgi:putative hydrolase of the HAD superfamily